MGRLVPIKISLCRATSSGCLQYCLWSIPDDRVPGITQGGDAPLQYTMMQAAAAFACDDAKDGAQTPQSSKRGVVSPGRKAVAVMENCATKPIAKTCATEKAKVRKKTIATAPALTTDIMWTRKLYEAFATWAADDKVFKTFVRAKLTELHDQGDMSRAEPHNG